MTNILTGMTVIDLTQNVAGPYCTQILGDLGAEVIKIERLETGDDTRLWTPPAWDEESATFLGLNRNKKSLSIDLNSAKGQQIVKQLTKEADIFIHSMKPGSMETRGLGYEDISLENPGLIYASISAFGDEGPMMSEPGYDPIIQAYAGIMSLTGNPGDDPARVGVSITDMATGMWSLIGILSAIIKRNSTGEGSEVSNSLLETGVAWVSLQLSNYMATGKVPQKIGTAAPMMAPYEAFKAKDGWVIIAAANNRLFHNLCEAIGIPQEVVKDPRYVTNSERINNRKSLHEVIEKRTLEIESEELIQLLQKKKVPCSSINSLDKVYKDEQINALGLIKDVESFRIKDFKIVDLPFKVGERRAELRLNPPELGEHTNEIMKALNFSRQEIEEMKKEKIIG